MSTALERHIPLPELAKKWGCSQDVLYRKVRAGTIPYLRIDGRIFFEPSQLEAWKAAARRGAVHGATEEAPPSRRRTREEECAALGIPTDHAFS